jgi:hypothetical protein
MSGFNLDNYDPASIEDLRRDVLAEKADMTENEKEIFDMARAFGLFEAVAMIVDETADKGKVDPVKIAKRISLAGFAAILESE